MRKVIAHSHELRNLEVCSSSTQHIMRCLIKNMKSQKLFINISRLKQKEIKFIHQKDTVEPRFTDTRLYRHLVITDSPRKSKPSHFL